jgi:hypothetical protein
MDVKLNVKKLSLKKGINGAHDFFQKSTFLQQKLQPEDPIRLKAKVICKIAKFKEQAILNQ